MENYRCNRNCGCLRCRYRGIMGPVVLITVGVLFLLEELHVHDLDFDRTWPLILIAIGVVKMLQRTAPTEGHIQPFAMPPATQVPGGMPNTAATPDAQSTVPQSEVRHE